MCDPCPLIMIIPFFVRFVRLFLPNAWYIHVAKHTHPSSDCENVDITQSSNARPIYNII
jgi:hypothetical protein